NVAVGRGVAVAVAVGRAVDVAVNVAVGRGVAVAVNVALGRGVAVNVAVARGVAVAVGVGEVSQLGNLKLAMRVDQLNVPSVLMYSVVYQNVQSSVGSTVMAE